MNDSIDGAFDRPRRHTPTAFVIAAWPHVRRVANGSSRRRFYRDLAEHARTLGLVMGQAGGWCVFLGAERVCTARHRHDVLAWLVDDERTHRIDAVRTMGSAYELYRAVDPRVARAGSKAALCWLHFVAGSVR